MRDLIRLRSRVRVDLWCGFLRGRRYLGPRRPMARSLPRGKKKRARTIKYPRGRLNGVKHYHDLEHIL